MPSCKIRGTNDTFDFGSGLVEVDGEEKHGLYWPLTHFKNLFLVCVKSQKPESQEDWKSILWTFGGPKPSTVEEVFIRITDDAKVMVLLWKEKVKSGV